MSGLPAKGLGPRTKEPRKNMELVTVEWSQSVLCSICVYMFSLVTHCSNMLCEPNLDQSTFYALHGHVLAEHGPPTLNLST